MKVVMKLLASMVLVAMLIVPGGAMAQEEDWLVNLTLTTNPHIGSVPGPGYAFAFGARDGATEGYDPAEGDQIAPPDPMIGIAAYFHYPDNPAFQRNLAASVVGPEASITWPLLVKSVGDPGATQATLTWDTGDIGNVPARYTVLELRDTAGNTLANMRTAASYTFIMSSNETRNFHVVAVTGITTHTLTTAVSPTGGGTATDLTNASPYDEGAVVQVWAEPAAGYRFVHWTAPTGLFANASAAETTFTMPAQAVTVTAHFEAVMAEDWLVNLSLTTNPHIGSVPGPGVAFAFGARDGATEGYDEAEGDQIAPPDPMMGINAYFYYPDNPAHERNLVTSVVGPEAAITWPLLVKSVGDPGTTQATLTWETADMGSVPARYTVLELQDTDGNTLADLRTAASYTFTLSSNETRNFHVLAEEADVPTYALTMAVAPPGSGTATDLISASPYAAGTPVTIRAVAAAGYRFVHWTAPAGFIANPNAAQTTFTMPAQAVTVTAHFAVAAEEDWLVNLSLTTDPGVGSVPGAGYSFAFGARDGATEGYSEADGDQVAPPDPMVGVNAYFYYPDNPMFQRNLITSVVGPAAAITWPLLVKSVGDPGATHTTLTWDAEDIGDVPDRYGALELRDNAGDTLADMRTEDSYTFLLLSNETKFLHVLAAEHAPPEVSSVEAQQRTDGSGIVDVTYDVFDHEQLTVHIALEYWDGSTWNAVLAVTGDAGPDVGVGADRQVAWDARAQLGEVYIAASRIKVRAQGVGGTGEAEGAFFALDTAPPTGYGPETPPAGATGVAVEPELTSTAASDDSLPVEYRFLIATDSGFTEGIQESAWQTGTGWVPPASLECGTVYHWKVKARDAKGNESEWSPACSFTTIFEFTYRLRAGWNMISLPLHTEETSPEMLFPGSLAVYSWNPVTLAYDLPTELVPGEGYWVLYMSDATRTIHGVPVERYELTDATAGWHMVGSLWADARVAVKAGSVLDSFYWWNPETPSFDATTTLTAGKGYWLLGFTSFGVEVEPKPPFPP